MIKINFKKVRKILPYPIFTSLSILFFIGFAVFSIVPEYRSINKVRQDIKMAYADIEELEKITPAFTKVKKINAIKFEPKLSFPERTTLDRKKLSRLLNKFQIMAQSHKLRLTDNQLDTNAITKQSNSVSILLAVRGQLHDFRKFLISIISLPFFDKIEAISIHTGNNSENFFNINLKIHIETQHE